MERYKKVILPIIALVVVLGLSSLGISALMANANVLPETLEQRMQNSLDEIESELTSGKTLHIKILKFKRQGTASSLEEPEPWIYPENTVGDVFLGPVDSEGNFTNYNVLLKDLEGNILQEVYSSGDVVIFRDVRTGEERQSPYTPISVNEYLQSYINTANYMMKTGWSVDENVALKGEDTIVFSKFNDWKDVYSQKSGASGIISPYIQDLDPKQTFQEIEVFLANPLLHTEQHSIIDQQGNNVLIEEMSYVAVEVIDSETK